MWSLVLLFLIFLNVWLAAHATNSCTTPNGQSGLCIPLESCRLLNAIQLNNPNDLSVVEFLRKSYCSNSFENDEMPVVCCSTNLQPPSTNPKLHNECGRTERLDLRVVNGTPSEPGDWPWIAALGYHKGMDTSLRFSCGGSLIADNWVVTAGHCVAALPQNFKLVTVRLGDLNLDSKVDDQMTPVDIPIQKVFLHQNFSANPLMNDIALIQLKDTVNFSQNIRPICILSGKEARSDSYYKNTKPIVIGWGRLEQNGAQANHLQAAELRIIDNTRCTKMYASERDVKIDQRVLCAAAEGKDACQGDSGGPLMFDEKSNGDHKFYLGGVVSFGKGCADRNFPGGYTRVAPFTDWIEEITGLRFH